MTETQLLDVVMLVARLIIGPAMFAHGYQKYFLGGRIDGTAGWFDSIGMRPGRVHAYLASFTEMGSGVLMTLGLLAPFAGAAYLALMVVAGWTVHRSSGFFIVKGGYEYNVILAAFGVVCGVLAGGYSLDEAFGITFSPGARLAIALGVGLVGGLGQLAAFYRPPADA